MMNPCAVSVKKQRHRHIRILLSSAELSASDAAAALVPALRRLAPDALLYAFGSHSLATAGVTVLADPTGTASVGHWEYFAMARHRRRLFREALGRIREIRPDLVICIDSPAFNVRLAERVRAEGIPVACCIPPQEYLWGRTGLAVRIARACALVGCIDETSQRLYAGLGVRTLLTGHPLARIKKRATGRKATRSRADAPRIALFPGSRRQEIRRIAPVILAAAVKILAVRPGARFFLPLADERDRATLAKAATRLGLPLTLTRREDARALLANVDLVITKAGTTTLDAALAGCPLVVLYRLHPLTYWIATKILRIQNHIAGISLPNIYLREPLVPEFIQRAMKPDAIARAALAVLSDPGPQKEGLARAVRALARPAAALRFVSAALELLPDKHRPG